MASKSLFFPTTRLILFLQSLSPPFWPFSYYIFLLLRLRGPTSRHWYIWDFLVSVASRDDRFATYSPFKKPLKLLANLDVLCDPLSIGSGQSWDYLCEMSIRLLRVSFYLLRNAKISVFLFLLSTVYLITRFLKLLTI